MADLTFTTIEEAARHTLNISRDEYAACNYVQTWAAHPSNKTPGFCNRTRGQMALFVGISERGMQKMLIRLEGMDLIKRVSQSQFLYRITERWFDIVVAAKEQRTGEQSSRHGVNKVPGGGEQSSRHGVNKVPIHKEYNKEVNKQQQKEKIDVAIFDLSVNALIVDSIPLEAKKEKDTPNSAAPLEKEVPDPAPLNQSAAPIRYNGFDMDTEAHAMKHDFRCFERYARDLSTSLEVAKLIMPKALDEFVFDQHANAATYPNRTEFRKHFWNWLPRRNAAKKVVSQNQPAQNLTSKMRQL